jgi:hypothetical protein
MAPLEPDNYASLYAEIALVVVAAGERIAETRQDVIGLRCTDGEHFIDWNVDAPTNDEIKRIVRGRTDATAAQIANVYECVGMGAAEHRLREWLEMRGAEFNLRTYVVCEQISGDRSATGKSSGGAAVPLEFGFDPNQVGQKISERAAPAVERKSSESGNVAVLRIEAHVGIVPGNFHFGAILCKGSASEKQNERNKE